MRVLLSVHDQPSAPSLCLSQVQHGVLHIHSPISQVLSPTHNASPFDLPVTLRLLGAHQGDNAATATVAAAVLSNRGNLPGIDAGAVTQGLADAMLPGRFQVILGCNTPHFTG